MEYKDTIMNFELDGLLDEAEKVETGIYDLLTSMITTARVKDLAIQTSSDIITELNKLDSIINELCFRVDSSACEVKRLNELRRTDPYALEKGKSKLEKFKFADASEEPITEEFNAEDLMSLIEDVICDGDCLEDEEELELPEEPDFSKLVKDFVGSRVKCD